MRARFVLAVSALLAACEPDPASIPQVPAEDLAAEEGLGPRQLRLLTRREYNATVAALFDRATTGQPAPTCESDAGCDVRVESCVGGTCQEDPCELVTFVHEGAVAAATVVVAGSFNDWGATEQAGGFAMAFEPSLGAWVTKRPLVDGTHRYKFVIDGVTWVADGSNPNGEPDGFGGVNSLLEQSCAGQPRPPSVGGPSEGVTDYAADFPVESRPEGYPYDNGAAAGLVTSTHVEQYLRAGKTLAAEHAATLLASEGCEAESASEPCVREALARFGRRAFRRPLEAAELDRLHALVAGQASLDAGIDVFLRVVLSSPSFLYRFEIGEDLGDGSARLDGYEVATALSYALVGSTPTDALLDAAEGLALDTPEGVEAAARELLDDPRARDVIGAFAEQWLAIESLEQADKSDASFPEFDVDLARAMKQETRDLVVRVALDDAPFGELFLSSRTTATGTLAALYAATPDGALPAARHAGLLSQASVLASEAHSDQTSPVKRGLFVRTRLLCQELPPPPANAGGLPEVDPSATTRERFQQHAADPACSGCHQHIDPVGFGFEGFDAIGRARDTDAGKPVDVSGAITGVEGLATGTDRTFSGLPELGAILAESERAKECLVRQLHRRATGGLEVPEDDGTIASLTASFAASGHDVRELLVAMTQVRGFAYRRTR